MIHGILFPMDLNLASFLFLLFFLVCNFIVAYHPLSNLFLHIHPSSNLIYNLYGSYYNAIFYFMTCKVVAFHFWFLVYLPRKAYDGPYYSFLLFNVIACMLLL